MILTILLIVLVVSLLIFVNALYVAGEFATVSARKTRIIKLAEEGNRLARTLLPVLEDHHRLDNYIAASQVGITLSSITLGIYGERQIAPLIAPLVAKLPLGSAGGSGAHLAAAGISVTLVLFLLTTLQVVFGELLPKSIAMQYPERMALTTALPMKWSADIVLKPLIVILNGSGALILKLLGSSQAGHAHVHSPEEILILVGESHEGGLIDAEEQRFLHRAFRSGDMRVVEIAVPRTRMVTAPVTDSVKDVLHLAAESAYSRIPIYDGDIDHIIGFVHLRDLFTRHRSGQGGDLHDILRSLPFVPETLTVAETWARLDEAQSYLAIVFDEYGGTSGLVTREDLIEELFGELQDEFDQELAPVRAAGDGCLVVRGDMPISTLNDLLNTDLPHDRAHTIGGLLMDVLDRIPQEGDAIDLSGLEIRALSVQGRSVLEACVILPPDTPPPHIGRSV